MGENRFVVDAAVGVDTSSIDPPNFFFSCAIKSCPLYSDLHDPSTLGCTALTAKKDAAESLTKTESTLSLLRRIFADGSQAFTKLLQ